MHFGLNRWIWYKRLRRQRYQKNCLWETRENFKK